MIIVNPPPNDNRCESCRKHTSVLEPFDESPREVDKLVYGVCVILNITDDRKLAKSFRSDDGDVVYPRWECKQCFFQSDEIEDVHQEISDLESRKSRCVRIKASIYSDDAQNVLN